MTHLEKQIYNAWLAVNRGGQGKPFKLRKKWDGFEDKPEYGQVKRLARLFTKFSDINISDFFKAPILIYPESSDYDLRFYNSLKAIKCYKIYRKKIENNKK